MGILFGRTNFIFVRGTDWNDVFILTDADTGAAIDLTGATDLLLRVRDDIASTTVRLERRLSDGGLTILDRAAGKVKVLCDSQTTHDSFPANDQVKAVYVYDALIERTAGRWEPATGGKVTVLPQVSRPLDDTP